MAIFLVSCSHGLVGTWNVQKYETNTAGEHNISLQNIGSMTFDKAGTGDKQIEYSVLGMVKKDTLPFKWNATEKQVTINSKNSEFGKTWIIIENKGKFQKWKSTDGTNQIQMIELAK
jgi:hypothetical protein